MIAENPGVLARRKLINVIMLSLTGVCTVLTASILFFILGYLLYYGGTSINWTFLTKLPAEGGMANAILGSAMVLTLATLIGFPIGFLGGVYLSEFGRGWFPSLVRYTADLLNGVPSILIGVLVYSINAVLLPPSNRYSALAGAFALAILMIPIVLRSTEEFLRAVPMTLREGAIGLGASKYRTILTVVIPSAAGGIVTALMLALARIAGETAPLLFTAWGNPMYCHSLFQKTDTVPVLLYQYAINGDNAQKQQAWAAGFLLLSFILVINVIARMIVAKRFKFAKR